MKTKINYPFVIIGAIIVVTSIWLGAAGMHFFAAVEFEFASFITGVLFCASGAILAVHGFDESVFK